MGWQTKGMRIPNRRDLIKLFASAAGAYGIRSVVRALPAAAKQGGHLIIIVFDAWSARNVSLYGYPRPTMPNLEAFAKTGLVYNQHHSTANFTIPGVASLLTGVYPFQHRALSLNSQVAKQYQAKNIFNYFNKKYSTVAFAQNTYADQILQQADPSLDQHMAFGTFNLANNVIYDATMFKKDPYIAYNALDSGVFKERSGGSGSLFISPILALLANRQNALQDTLYAGESKEGLPYAGEPFTLNGIRDGLIRTLESLDKPSLVYFHIFTPHAPYKPAASGLKKFKADGLTFPLHPDHPLAEDNPPVELQISDRAKYDAYIADWDECLAELFVFFETSGLRNNSTIVITSDHGEMHDRGVNGHSTMLLSEPLLHVPLVITSPQISSPRQVNQTTSSVDILPTLCQLAGLVIPDWAEGSVLPGFTNLDTQDQPKFAFHAEKSSITRPVRQFSAAIYQDGIKLIRYQYPGYQTIEAYNLMSDPNEDLNIYPEKSEKLKNLTLALDKKLNEAGVIVNR